MKKRILIFGLILVANCLSWSQEWSAEALMKAFEKDTAIILEEQQVIIESYNFIHQSKLVESIVVRPMNKAKNPALLMIPGYATSARRLIPSGIEFAKAGIACIGITQRGFGRSEGEPDFVGPKTLAGLVYGLELFKKEPYVDATSIGIYGYSRGGIAASLLACRLEGIKAAIFGAGVYDFKKAYEEVTIEGIRANIDKETGSTEMAFAERSSILEMDNLKAPVLILHGSADPNVPVNQAYLLEEKLKALNKDYEIQIFDGVGHWVGRENINKYGVEFMQRKLLKGGLLSTILDKKRIDWQDYDSLFTDSSKTTFLDEFAFLSSMNMYEIIYQSDSLRIKAFMATPKHPGKYPAIICNRGGNRDFGALSLFGGEWKTPAAHRFSRFTEAGYVVIGCNYRGSGGSEGMEEFGGKDVHDVMNLVKVLKEIPEVDTTKIGMFGWSRGGMMTYLALTKTNQIKVAVVGGAPSDLTVIDRPEMEQYVYAELMPNYWENKEEELKKRSAIFWADQFSKEVPILILHGNADWRVKPENSLKLAMALEKHRVPYRLKIYEGGDHGIREHREDVNKEIITWFNRFLKDGEVLPNMAYHGR